jgi:dihydroxyacetone kinase
VILNGLGSVKYEELFVLYRRVAQLLAEAGVEPVQPEVGELVTSFQMAGTSLTLTWLDDELERTWRAPASTPAFRKGAAETRARRSGEEDANASGEAIPAASDDSRDAVPVVVAALEAAARVVDEARDELGRIDAVAGDGDHGIGMQRGVAAAVRAAAEVAGGGAGAGTVLSRAGDAWADRAGGTSGALWGIILRSIGAALGDDRAPDRTRIAIGVTDAASEVQRFGKAKRGDKTMLDTLIPFAEALALETRRQPDLPSAWAAASRVAQREADATARLLPKMGRARPHAEKSLGTPDAGAVSMALIINAIGSVLATKGTQS